MFDWHCGTPIPRRMKAQRQAARQREKEAKAARRAEAQERKKAELASMSEEQKAALKAEQKVCGGRGGGVKEAASGRPGRDGVLPDLGL